LANALDRKPQLATEIGRCVIMGGAPCGAGNITPVAEYNFWVDPEAAKLVMGSKLDIELIGLHLSRGDAALNSAEIGEIAALPGARAQFALASTSKLRKAYSARTGTDSLSLPDPVAMAIALDPTIAIQWGEHFVDVETRSKLTRGMCVVDWNDIAGDEINRPVWQSLLEDGRKAKICWKIDQRRWKQAFFCVFV
jgi:purine nucleosidase